MSWLSNIGHAITKGVTDVGHFVGKVASNPIVDTAAGIFGGPLAGAVLGGAGKLLAPGGNIGSAVGGALQGGLAGGLGSGIKTLGSGILQNGVGATLKGALGSGLLHPTGTFAGSSGGGYGNIIDYDAGGNPIYSSDGNGGLGGIAGSIFGGIGKLGGGSLGNLAATGLAGYQAYNSAQASKRAGQLSDQSLALANQRYAEGAPLRAAGQAHLLNPTRPDLSAIYTDTTNPFAKRPPTGLDAMAQLLGRR